jgi:hypothetical protein
MPSYAATNTPNNGTVPAHKHGERRFIPMFDEMT